MRQIGWVATLSAALLMMVGVSSAQAQPTPSTLDITVDENGHGTYNYSGGEPPLYGSLQPDPGPGAMFPALTYSIPGPPGASPPPGVVGDVMVMESGGWPDSPLGDWIRFNPGNENDCSGGVQVYVECLVFYSAAPPFDSLADVPAPPAGMYPTHITLSEGANGELVYTPLAGQPGFVPDFDTTYTFISDVPEPGSLAIFGSGLALLALRRRTRRA